MPMLGVLKALNLTARTLAALARQVSFTVRF